MKCHNIVIAIFYIFNFICMSCESKNEKCKYYEILHQDSMSQFQYSILVLSSENHYKYYGIVKSKSEGESSYWADFGTYKNDNDTILLNTKEEVFDELKLTKCEWDHLKSKGLYYDEVFIFSKNKKLVINEHGTQLYDVMRNTILNQIHNHNCLD